MFKAFYIFSFLFLLFAYSSPGFAIIIPDGVKETELDTMISALGYGTSTKFLSDPYPLGGYTGLEVGITLEIVNIEELARIGNGTSSQSEFRYNRISIGKGLYKNLDAFAHFVPYSSSNQISDFGGLFKWSFYQGKYLPFSASIMANLNTMNIQDKFINQNIGTDMMIGVDVNRLALYLGGGFLRARSIINCEVLDFCTAGTDAPYKTTSSSTHSFVGVQFEFYQFFLIGQIDRYDDPVYSLKLGYRN